MAHDKKSYRVAKMYSYTCLHGYMFANRKTGLTKLPNSSIDDMKPWILYFIVCFFAMACNQKPAPPDVSHIAVPLQTIRFEQAFFKLDTNSIDHSLGQLHQSYPGFTQDFLFNILGTAPNTDTAAHDVKQFIATYKGLYDTAQKVFANWAPIEKEVHEGLQRVKYYFPKYAAPTKLITFIGPLNSYGNIITQDALAIGLQLYLGKNCSIYTSDQGVQMYPQFISRKFEPAYIATNCMKNIVDDMFAANHMGQPLVEQMIELGKKIYLLDVLLPNTPDSIKIGYTQQQLTECLENEKNIWSFFVQNDLLYANDLSLIAPYVTDGPKTETLGSRAPGNIGSFVGWQIVKKWMRQNAQRTPELLMQTNAKVLFQESKYKP